MATDAAVAEPVKSERADPLVHAVPFFYGWVMLAVSMISQFATSPGQTYGVSVFNKHISTSLDIDLTTISAAYMWGTLLACFPLSIVGAISDKIGLRKSMAIIVSLFAISCCGMSLIQGPLSLFFGFLAIRLFGQGSMSLLSGTTLDMWFRDRLGFAAGIRNLSIPLAIGIYPAATILLIDQVGWRTAYTVLGIGLCLLMYPILIFVFRNKPEDIGQLPDGTLLHHKNSKTEEHKQGLDLPQLTMGEAMQTRAYWILISLGFVWGMIATAMMFMIVPFIESQGLVEADARWIFLSLAISMAVFQFVGGYLADRISLNLLLGIGTLGMAVGVALYAQISSITGEVLYGVVFGASQGLAAAGASPMWARYFGRAHLGKIKGTSMTAMVAGSSLGPYVMSKGFDLFDSYLPAFVLFMAIYVIQGIAGFFATSPADRADDIAASGN